MLFLQYDGLLSSGYSFTIHLQTKTKWCLETKMADKNKMADENKNWRTRTFDQNFKVRRQDAKYSTNVIIGKIIA